MDFGSGTWNGGPIGIPFNLTNNATPIYGVDFYYPGESDNGPYPIPSSPAIEYGSDHHILSINSDNCTLYEIYDASFSNGNWAAGSGAIWNMNSNTLRPDGWTSADAAGLPIFPGLARYEEVAAGTITHALRFTTNCTANYYIWPARHVAQSGSCSNPVPFGARFRLKESFNIGGFSPQAQAILQAMKTYGIILADNGSPWYISGAPNENWNNSILHEMDIVTGNNFEAVDTAGLVVDFNSGEASSSISNQSFGDVPSNHPYFTDIEILYANGLTAGCSSSPLLFCPDTVMDRAQSAVFMLRGNLGISYAPPNPPFGSTFGDNWGPGPWAQKWAQGMLQQGLTAGCSSSPLLYCPWEAMPRLQAAVFGMRLMNGNAYIPPAATGTIFADLTDTSPWYTKWAEQAYLNGLLPACGSSGGKPLFCPNDLVSRGLGAYMIVRAKNLTMP